MKKLWKTYKRSLYSKAEFYQKREDLYNIDTLFICYFGYNCLYIINLILSLILDHRRSQDYVETFIPIGLILIFLSIIYCLKRKVFTFSFEKEQYQKYIFYFDLLKGVMYIILAVIIVEGKLLQISKENEPKSYHDGYWLSSELGLISLPVILSIQTCSVKLSLIVFQYLYSFLRMQGWDDEYIDGIFLLVKTLPIMFCLYRFYLFEDKLRIDKSRQAEDRKFASTVLDLLPEGVAIVDEEGLKYHNNSLRAILNVKDSQCLEALSALQNKDFRMYEDNHMMDKRRITLNNELNKHNIPSYTEAKSVKGSVFLRTELNTAESPSRKKVKSVTSKSTKTNKDGTLARLDTKVKIVDPKNSKSQPVLPRKETEAIGTIFEPFSGRKEETSIIFSGEQTNLLSPAQHREITKINLGEQSPGLKGTQPTDFFINDRKNEESTTLQNLNKKQATTFSEVTGVRLRVKQIIDKIHQPYEKSQHQNVGEAIRDLLYKLKSQFPTQDLLYSNPPEFVKQLQSNSSAKPSKKYMSRSATFNNGRAKAKKKTRFFPLSHVAMIMNSERESINGNAQRLEIKFTPVIVQSKPSLIILIRDVTEREVIKQMEEKERSQSQALAAVSHEFRTPLNGILGMLDTLKDQITSEIAQDYLMPAYNSAKLLLTLVNDILDFHQLKEQKFTLIPAQFNLRSKVEDCLSLISFQAKRRGLKTQVVIDPGVPKYINNDPNRVQQVINNLLGNAIKFTLEGSITIKVEVYSERVYTIKVIDTGIGIKPENIQKLFKTFGKIDSKENRELNPQGVGLGLTISNSLAEILCADSRVSGLNVTSEYQKGSTFWFLIDDIPTLSESCEIEDEKEKALFDNMEDLNTRFPWSEKAISPNKATSVSRFFSSTMGERLTELQLPRLRSNLYLSKYTTNGDVSPHKKIVNTETQLMFNQEAVLKHIVKHFKTTKKETPTVLIVDDNDINHLVFQNFLKNFDMTIESAYNGQQALQKVLQRNKNVDVGAYAVVFLDVEMPMMGGIECTHHLRGLMESGEITKFPIIGQSGHENQEEVIKCLEAGMSDYLRKPISKTKLLDIMIKWLGEAEI